MINHLLRGVRYKLEAISYVPAVFSIFLQFAVYSTLGKSPKLSAKFFMNQELYMLTTLINQLTLDLWSLRFLNYY